MNPKYLLTFILLSLLIPLTSAATTILDNDITTDGNITIGDQITFRLGEIIDNLVNDFIRLSGSVNITQNLTIQNNLTIVNLPSCSFIGTDSNGLFSCASSGTDTNESIRFDNLVSFDCPPGQLAIGVQVNGTILCATDEDQGNPFDQNLNTTEAVTFHNVTATNNITAGNWLKTANFVADAYFPSPPNGISFNIYDDGSELFLNVSSPEAFNIETDSAKIVLFDDPKLANDFKLFQIFNKMATVTTEFVVTQAKPELTSYFIRSLSLAGNGSAIPSPHNCTTYAQFIDCNTDLTGPDFFVLDDIEIWGSLYTGNGTFNVTDIGNVGSQGNVTAQFYFGDGSQLTNLPEINPFDQNLNTTSNVQFANLTSSGNLTLFGNATFLDRVGIGTASPTQTLNVVGNFNMTNSSNDGIYQNSSCSFIAQMGSSLFAVCT